MGKKVLFVDDNADWRAMMEMSLKEAGYEVSTAKDASEALLQMGEGKPAVMVLDLDLAGESGAMLMKFVKQNDPDLPIILYTGLDQDAEVIMTLLAEGAHSYVRKGSPQELIQALEEVLK
jgi:CheY-like chemotaxis protein